MAKISFGMPGMAHMPSVALAFALLGAPAAAFAQSGVPNREGNIWGWTDHQPTMAQVQQQEKAAGIAPTPSQRDKDTTTVDQLYRQLMHQPAER
jgi:hypothetical protein